MSASCGISSDTTTCAAHRATTAVRQARLLVQIDNHRLRVRSQLRRRGPQGVRGLQRMTALNSALALLTTANVDVDPAVDRLPWDLELILPIDVGFIDGASAVGAGIG